MGGYFKNKSCTYEVHKNEPRPCPVFFRSVFLEIEPDYQIQLSNLRSITICLVTALCIIKLHRGIHTDQTCVPKQILVKLNGYWYILKEEKMAITMWLPGHFQQFLAWQSSNDITRILSIAGYLI